jgi:alginate O-acetyltransferase complex protein AlgI
MIFSSPGFILVFLPIVFFGYFLLNRIRLTIAGKAWLVAASLFFYSFWNAAYLPLLLGSIAFNFSVGTALASSSRRSLPVPGWLILVLGITANLLLLGYFKYANFLVDNVNFALGTSHAFPRILLPLGISFFTFTQIAYLVDSHRGEAREYDILNYALFVTFFPHLIAGPILHHGEMMSQFRSRWNLSPKWRNIALGFFLFSIGLFKKVILADTFAIWANAGFDGSGPVDFFSSWAASVSYAFQIYFDFSGYCDMALGASLLFNIRLPVNFNSPYKAIDIQDFWRRWHITLSRYLRDYLYIPLGGNRCSVPRTYLNLVITFVLGGLWHGASWMFVIWGALHGMALVLHRIWLRQPWRLPVPLAWTLTFLFVNVSWVFFRAKDGTHALRLLRGMTDFQTAFSLPLDLVPTGKLAWGGGLVDDLLRWLPTGVVANLPCMASLAAGFLILSAKSSTTMMDEGAPGYRKMGFAILLFTVAFYGMLGSTSTEFLYFNF